mgnify:CR=1 FL=1
MSQSTLDDDDLFGEAAEEAPFTPGVSIDVPSTVAPGDTMEASVTAENTGDVAGNATLSISVAGEEQFSETVSLDAGASTSETVSYTVPNDTNASSVSVSAEYGDASDSATVTIEQPDDDQGVLDDDWEQDVPLDDVREYVETHPEADVYEVMREFRLGGDAFDVVERLVERVDADSDDSEDDE